MTVEALLQMRLNEVERFVIKKTMEREENNISESARVLGISRATMYRKLRRYGFYRLVDEAIKASEPVIPRRPNDGSLPGGLNG